MAEVSRLAKSLKSPFQWIAVGLMLLFVLWIVFTPINGHLGPRANPVLQDVRTIDIALFQYANDYNGLYPTGKSSTDVFQKLIDEGYVTDPSIFYDKDLNVPGKTKATSKKLKPENVCWDVTVPADANSSDSLPIVFSTGYKIEYVPNGKAVPLLKPTKDWPGIAVAYRSNTACYIPNDGLSDGVVMNFIPGNFDPAGKTYTQLTPDGPLSP
jgi:hypothetical protein